MRGIQCKALRKSLGLKKPTEASESGLFVDPADKKLKFRRRSNPEMNLYRKFKRMYKRGELK